MTAPVMTSVEAILRNVKGSLDFHNGINWWEILANKVSHNHFDWLCDEIKRDGFTVPVVIVIDDDEWRMGNGHHRLCAAILLGIEAIPVLFTDGDYWRFEDSHDGNVELSEPSYDYWTMLSGNMSEHFPGDVDNLSYRAQYEDCGIESEWCCDCEQDVHCFDCHECENARCPGCDWINGCNCMIVTPEVIDDNEYRHGYCVHCEGIGYAVYHMDCNIMAEWDEAIMENARHIPTGVFHPAYIIEDAYAEYAEWLKDEPLRRARAEWETAVARMRMAIAEGVSDTMVNIIARSIHVKWEAYQAL